MASKRAKKKSKQKAELSVDTPKGIPNAIRFGNLRWSEGATERRSDRAHEFSTSGAERYTLNPCMLRAQTRSLFGGHQAHAADLSAPQQAATCPDFSGKRHLNRPAKPAYQHPLRGLNLQPSTCTSSFSQTTPFFVCFPLSDFFSGRGILVSCFLEAVLVRLSGQ